MKIMSMTKRIICIILSAIMILGTVTIAWAKYNNDTIGWIQDIYNGDDSPRREGFWYKNPDGTFPKSTWKQIGGKYYYFDEEGYLLRNTTTPDGYQVDREGVWIENLDYSSICAESFNPSVNYKITLNSLGGMSIEDGHYLRSDSMSGKFPKKVTYEEYGTYNIWSPNIKNVTFKSLRIGGAGGSGSLMGFVWTDNNYEYLCDENGRVKHIFRKLEIRIVNN